MVIFLSYSRENKNPMDDIHSFFSEYPNYLILRDITSTTFKADFREHMKKVYESNYVLTLVSHDFLISKNCMHEVCLTLSQDENFEVAVKKILPFLIEGTVIKYFKSVLDYELIWKRQYVEAIDMIKETTTVNPDLLEDLKIIQTIYAKISKFITYLQTTDYAYWSSDQNRNKDEFDRVISYINNCS